MNPDLLLSVAASVAGFLLKTSAAFAVCLVLCRLVPSANQRFILWSGLVYGSATYWLYQACCLVLLRPERTATFSVAAPPPGGNLGVWQIPTSWALAGNLAVLGAGIIYLAILAVLLFTYIRKRLHLHWILGFTQQPPIEVAQAFQALARSLRVAHARLLVLPGSTSPATFGWVRPTVLLPSICLNQDSGELEDILRHELQHVRRCDSVWNGLAMSCRGLLFFHPAIWYAVKRMQLDRELACDFAVIAWAPARKEHYAECLLRFARLNLAHEAGDWGIDFAASEDHLTVRVHTILAGSKRVPIWLQGLRSAFGLALFALLVGSLPSLAVLLSYARQPGTHPASPPVQTPVHATRRAAAASRKSRSPLLALSSPANTDSEQAISPEMELPAIEKTAPELTSVGPRLSRRGAPLPTPVSQAQAVFLTDTDVGEKDGALDRKQVVQQTATAVLGVYQKVAAVDRH